MTPTARRRPRRARRPRLDAPSSRNPARRTCRDRGRPRRARRSVRAAPHTTDRGPDRAPPPSPAAARGTSRRRAARPRRSPTATHRGAPAVQDASPASGADRARRLRRLQWALPRGHPNGRAPGRVRTTDVTSSDTPAAGDAMLGSVSVSNDESSESPWASSVVLGSGDTAFIRPLTVDDKPALAEFHRQQSPESIYRRYFSPKPELNDKELDHFTAVDMVDRAALVVESHDEFIAWASYERWPGRNEAEAAFMVADGRQGEGIATLLLEHLAAIARSNGIERFTAEVLGDNRAMLAVFAKAGWPLQRRFDSGRGRPRLGPGDDRRVPRQRRTTRAACRFASGGEDPDSPRRRRDRGIRTSGKRRRRDLAQRRRWRRRPDLRRQPPPRHDPRPAVSAFDRRPTRRGVPGDHRRPRGIPACNHRRLHRQTHARGGDRHLGRRHRHRRRGHGRPGTPQRTAHHRAVEHGHRLPSSRDPLAGGTRRGHAPRRRGRDLDAVRVARRIAAAQGQRGRLGISWFISLGDKSDISANDLLQFWEFDDNTTVVAMYTESFGNPRKFARIARRVSRTRPIVAVRTGAAATGEMASALYQQTGLIEVPTVPALLETVRVLATQPVLQGPRVAVLTNSRSPGTLASAALSAAGLEPVAGPITLDWSAGSTEYPPAMRAALADDTIDGLIVIHAPAVADDVHAAGVSDRCRSVGEHQARRRGTPRRSRWTGRSGVTCSRVHLPRAGSRRPRAVVRVRPLATRRSLRTRREHAARRPRRSAHDHHRGRRRGARHRRRHPASTSRQRRRPPRHLWHRDGTGHRVDAATPPWPTPTRSVTPLRSRPYAAVPAGRPAPELHSTSPPTTTSSRRLR